MISPPTPIILLTKYFFSLSGNLKITISPRFGSLNLYCKRLPIIRFPVIMVFSIDPEGTLELAMMKLLSKKAMTAATTIICIQLRISLFFAFCFSSINFLLCCVNNILCHYSTMMEKIPANLMEKLKARGKAKYSLSNDFISVNKVMCPKSGIIGIIAIVSHAKIGTLRDFKVHVLRNHGLL